MSGTKIIACEMLRPEIESIIDETSLDYELIWIEPALHVTPNCLNQRLQEVFDGIDNCEWVLMPFGNCGGALKGLTTGNFKTVIPKVDDCLTLLLGSMQRRINISKEAPTFFLSLGWIKQESNILNAYDDMVKKYGGDMAKMLTETMYGNYERVALIDTGVGNYDELLAYEKPLKDTFGFEKYPVKGTTSYLRQLIFGPWDESKFTIIPSNTRM